MHSSWSPGIVVRRSRLRPLSGFRNSQSLGPVSTTISCCFSLMAEQKSILVTAGIVVNGDRVLICQRHHSDPYGMQWEFPGGKVNEGEELKTALCRELAEELTIEVEIGEEVFRLRHAYPDRNVEV